MRTRREKCGKIEDSWSSEYVNWRQNIPTRRDFKDLLISEASPVIFCRCREFKQLGSLSLSTTRMGKFITDWGFIKTEGQHTHRAVVKCWGDCKISKQVKLFKSAWCVRPKNRGLYLSILLQATFNCKYFDTLVRVNPKDASCSSCKTV